VGKEAATETMAQPAGAAQAKAQAQVATGAEFFHIVYNLLVRNKETE